MSLALPSWCAASLGDKRSQGQSNDQSKKQKEQFSINEKIKTCFVFRVRNIPAALYKAMGGFATNGVNMVRLESYMLDGSFTSTQFFAEIEGHPEDANVKLALEELSYYSTYIKMLGSFNSHS